MVKIARDIFHALHQSQLQRRLQVWGVAFAALVLGTFSVVLIVQGAERRHVLILDNAGDSQGRPAPAPTDCSTMVPDCDTEPKIRVLVS